MKLLLTGAFAYSDAQLEQLKALGCDITFVQDERKELSLEVSEFDGVVCNGCKGRLQCTYGGMGGLRCTVPV